MNPLGAGKKRTFHIDQKGFVIIGGEGKQKRGGRAVAPGKPRFATITFLGKKTDGGGKETRTAMEIQGPCSRYICKEEAKKEKGGHLRVLKKEKLPNPKERRTGTRKRGKRKKKRFFQRVEIEGRRCSGRKKFEARHGDGEAHLRSSQASTITGKVNSAQKKGKKKRGIGKGGEPSLFSPKA